MSQPGGHIFSQTAAVLEMREEDEEIDKFLREEEMRLKRKKEREEFWNSFWQEYRGAKHMVGKRLYSGIAGISVKLYTFLKLHKIPAIARFKDKASIRYQAYMTGEDPSSQNDSDTESVHSFATNSSNGEDIKDRLKKCGHYCQLWSKYRCCACSDTRPVNPENR